MGRSSLPGYKLQNTVAELADLHFAMCRHKYKACNLYYYNVYEQQQ